MTATLPHPSHRMPDAALKVKTDSTVELPAMRQAQKDWQHTPIKERLAYIKRARFNLLKAQDELVASVNEIRINRSAADSLSAEVLPLLSALQFLEKKAAGILKPRKHSALSGDLWMKGIAHEIRHEAHGLVLIIAPSNYPLFLFGTQAAQALAAGNAIILKPAPGCAKPMLLFQQAFIEAGLNPDLIQVTDDTLEAGLEVMEQGVDHVILTGSARSGTAVMHALAEDLTPSTMELSGSDAFLICEDADLERAAKSLKFGLFINDGATCMAPRRVIVHENVYDRFTEQLQALLLNLPQAKVSTVAVETASPMVQAALKQGARPLTESADIAEVMSPVVLTNTSTDMALLQADVFVPITSVVKANNHEDMIQKANDCAYGLGSSVFTASPETANKISTHIDAGMVMINDSIVPSADPRTPFIGRKHSGFEATQGIEGLLRMTRLKVISTRQFGPQPYIEERMPNEEALIKLLIQAQHAPSFIKRVTSLIQMMIAGMKGN